jgi:hypothetical protein
LKRSLAAVAALRDALRETQSAVGLACQSTYDAIVECRGGKAYGGRVVSAEKAAVETNMVAVGERDLDANVAIQRDNELFGGRPVPDEEKATEPESHVICLVVHALEQEFVGTSFQMAARELGVCLKRGSVRACPKALRRLLEGFGCEIHQQLQFEAPKE